MSRINMSKACGTNAVVSFGRNTFVQRAVVCCVAIGVALSIGNVAPQAFAVDFTWNGAASGNWTTAASWNVGVGHPDGPDDSATINATGSPYTASLNASKTIGEFHIASADATLTTGASILTIDGNAATTTNPGQFTHTAGVLNGNYRFIKANVSLNNVTSTAATVFDFRQFSACCGVQNSTIEFGSGGQIQSNQTFKATAFDSLGIITMTTTGSVSNLGTIDFNTAGIDSGGNQNHINWNLTGGTLTNQNLVNLASTRGSGSALVQVNANITNATGATFNVSTPTSGQVRFNKTGATHLNQSDFNVTGSGGGLFIAGNGTSFTQSLAGASLDATSFQLGTGGASPDTIQNVFSITGGSIGGNFILNQTAATLGAGITYNSPTTVTFGGETLNTWAGDVSSNVTVNVFGQGISEGTILNTNSSLANFGKIAVRSPGDGADFNLGLGRLVVNGGTGTLTNHGTLTFQSLNSGSWSTFADLNGNLSNEVTGVVTTNVTGAGSGTDQVRFLTPGSHTYTNKGLFTVETGVLNVVGGTINNQSTGTFAGQGTLQGTLLSSGTVGPGVGANDAGILNVNGAVNFAAGGKLVIDVLTGGTVAGTDYDRLAVTGSVTGLSNATLIVNINELLGAGDFTGDTLTILTTTTGNLSNQSFGAVQFVGGMSADVTYLTNSILLSNFVQIPEPGTGLMLLLGLVGCSIRNRRRNKV
jgi:fibronectin-binding autotransporter adhesin